MSTKALGADLTTSLLSEDPFLYAHLVKFEKVTERADGQIAEKASDYSYITDASFNISYDDNSSSLAGATNGAQTYIAGRLTKVGTVSETTEAKVSNVSLTVSSIGLSSAVVGSSTNKITIANSAGAGCTVKMIDQVESWVELGFAEGDEIKIASANDTDNNGMTLVISRFTSNNYDAVCIHPSRLPVNKAGQNDYNISLETVEVTSILDDPTSSTYNGYINREVSIWKAHIDPDTGTTIGAPYMLFKGIISKAKLIDDPTKNSTVAWTLTSHWGDFIRVNGRITSDSEHRAMGSDGRPDLAALYRDDYVADFGFMHGETAVNIMAIYQVMETRYKMKKSGWLFKKYKQVEYQVEVDREVDLRINLEAKRLPVIYGVQRTDSIPVFADSLYNDPSKIYVAYAICEGEVSGLYDIYVDDQSRICVDKNDSDTRSTQTDESTIDVLCEGRMDKGDTLSSATSVRLSATRGMPFNPDSFSPYSGGLYGFAGNWLDALIYLQNNIASSIQTNSATGVTHEKQTTLQYPIASKLVFHSGKSHQRADDTLVNIASRYGSPVTAGSFIVDNRYKIVTLGNTTWSSHGGNANAAVGDIFKATSAGTGTGTAKTLDGFKLQTDREKPEEYWTRNHRMLDTAYVVAEYEIAEGDTTIPTLDFVVRGKEIEQYNYDHSFDEHSNPSFTAGTIADKRALFSVGDYVKFFKGTGTGTALTTNVQIVDSYLYYNARNEAIHKFRFSSNPIAADDTTKEFYMVAQADSTGGTGATSDNRYPLITWDYKAVESGTIPVELLMPITTTSGDGSGTIAATTAANGTGVDVTFEGTNAALFKTIVFNGGSGVLAGFFLEGQDRYTLKNGKIVRHQVNKSGSDAASAIDQDVGGTSNSMQSVKYYGILNVVQLDSNAVGGSNAFDSYYNGQFITVVNTDALGVQKRQTREIVSYDGINKLATVGSLIQVATESSFVSGTHTATSVSNSGENPKTITLSNTTGLAPGQYLQANSSEGLAYVESGTKIDQISGSVITVNKTVRIQVGAVIKFLIAGAEADLAQINPEEFDFVPRIGDKYSIAAKGDKKVSINPAIQLTDYLTNGRYGRGLSVTKDLDLEAFKQAARLCDTRSDITLILNDNRTYTLGHTYTLSTPVSLPAATENIIISSLTVNERKAFGSLPSSVGRTVTVTIDGTDVTSSTYTVHSDGITFSTLPTGTDPVVITYSSLNTSIFQWQGVIKQISVQIGTGSSARREITFTNCVGKVAHKWFDWKAYEPGNIVYHKVGGVNKIYFVTAAGQIDEPAGGNYTSALFLINAGTSANAEIDVGATRSESGEGDNPLVKGWNGANYEKSGYELYDCDDVKYWRYNGWQEQSQREVTRHQTNALIRTDTPLFDNINSMLKHFNGILRYSNGKYQLDVESAAPAIPALSITTSGNYKGSAGSSTTSSYTDPRLISDDDIIGAITVDDSGLKGSANTVSVTIADPNIRFDNRSVSFFKSDYLKEDRNIPKKKDIKTPLITNYYNARINAEQYLDQSRFSRKINFVMGPKGVLLLAGTIIKMTYSRFGWVDKHFRVSNISYRPDCSVQVTADEHNDDTYIITAKEKNYQVSGPDAGPGDNTVKPISPSNLTATTDIRNMVTLSWTNTTAMGSSTSVAGTNAGWTTELWFSSSSTFATQIANTAFSNGAVRVHTSSGEESWDHNFPGILSNTTRYYWVRHVKTTPTTKTFSNFTPLNSASGVQGIAIATAVNKLADLYLYKATSLAVPSNQISGDSFPTLVVTLDNGSNHGIITSVATGQDSDMSIDGAGQIINGLGAGTGWYLSRQSVTASAKNAYSVYKRVSVSEDSANITKTDWSVPTLVGAFGETGDDVGHNASVENQNHTFYMNSAGSVINDFTSGTSVIHTDGSAFTYAASGTATKTYKITLSAFSGGVAAGNVVISNSGGLTLNGSSGIIANSAVKQGQFKLVISDNAQNDRVLGTYVFKFTKIVLTQRDGMSLEYTSSTYATAWAAAGDLTSAVAQGVAGLVIGDSKVFPDGPFLVPERRLVPNDKVTITNGTTQATRIWNSVAISVASQATGGASGSWSTPVVKHFQGSVIVDDTLSADKLVSNAIFSNQISIGSRMSLSNGGFFHSGTKNTLSSTVPGFYMDTAGNFSLGGVYNGVDSFMKYSPSSGALTLSGTFSIAGPAGPPTKTIVIYKLSSATTASVSTPNGSATVVFNTGVATFDNPSGSDTTTKSNDWHTTSPAPTTGLPYVHTKIAFVTGTNATTQISAATWVNGGIVSGAQGVAGTEASFPAITTLSVTTAQIANFTAGGSGTDKTAADAIFNTQIGRAPIVRDAVFLRCTTSGGASAAVSRNAAQQWEIYTAVIDGSMMVTDTITADKIDANAITASELQISNNSGSGSAGIFMDYNSGNSKIEIRDSSTGNPIRVTIGYLS